MPLFIDLAQGELLDIDSGRVRIRVEKKAGKRVRLAIQAAKEIPVKRIEANQ